MRSLLAAATILMGWSASGEATVRHVPAEYATIQAGVDASAVGDTVLVAPGTYTDVEVRGGWTACVFMKDGVVLRSEGGSAITVIDAHLASGPQMVIDASSIASSLTGVSGFTLAGTDPSWSGVDLLGRMSFRECAFLDLDGGQGSGGGMNANGDLTLIDCVFENCRAASGGAVYHSNGRLEMYGCTFRNCGEIGVFSPGNTVPPDESSHIEDCTFEGCWNPGGGGGGMQISGHRGGSVIRGCRFEGNVGGSSGGGGLYISGFFGATGAVVEDCLFLNNLANGPNGIGGGIRTASATTVRRCTFVGNEARPIPGGGAIGFLGSMSRLENSVVTSSSVGSALYVFQTTLASSCNVFWDNPGGIGSTYTPSPTDRVVDPLFCSVLDQDFRVRNGSPCLPAGSLGCDQIGAFGEGCGVVSIDPASWGQVKAAYRGGTGSER